MFSHTFQMVRQFTSNICVLYIRPIHIHSYTLPQWNDLTYTIKQWKINHGGLALNIRIVQEGVTRNILHILKPWKGFRGITADLKPWLPRVISHIKENPLFLAPKLLRYQNGLLLQNVKPSLCQFFPKQTDWFFPLFFLLIHTKKNDRRLNTKDNTSLYSKTLPCSLWCYWKRKSYILNATEMFHL